MGSSPRRVVVVGAAGRMGQRLCCALTRESGWELVAAVDSVGGGAIAGLEVSTELEPALAGVEVVIDFSAPAACARLAPICAAGGAAYVVGSTGIGDVEREALAAAASRIPVLWSANFSIGVNVLLTLVERAARELGDGFDLEIFELHHRGKRDAPSGTALSLAAAARKARGKLVEHLGRQGTHLRTAEELGLAAARGGDVSGEHTVFFLGDGERLELVHRATTPEIFVRGALRAAAWLSGRTPGCYSMRDVLSE